MLPISEFHFAFCGIATVAATLGYACARRAVFSLASSNESLGARADVESGTAEERSLKRKLNDSDEHDPDVEEQLRPMKRNKTPPIDQLDSDEDFNQEWEVIVAPPSYEQVVGFRQPEAPARDKSTPPQEDVHTIEQGVTPVRVPTPPAHSEASPQPEERGQAGRCVTPQPSQANLSPNESETPPACLVTPPKPTAPAKIGPVNAFSAFSGSSSPFASYSNATGTSPFALSGGVVRTAPAWRRDNESEPDVFGRASSPSALASSPNNTSSYEAVEFPSLSQSKGALRVSRETQSFAKPLRCLTGEEDETAEAELKGVKLFVKRGRKEFTDGIYGHIKILSQKSTSQKTGNEDALVASSKTTSRTRLLFRRDPLGQVSMNVGLHPTVRCHFDTAENILRVILMEQVMTDEEDLKEDVVIYALKPGRAQRVDFQSFAKVLCDHEGFKSRVVTSQPNPASAAAAAS